MEILKDQKIIKNLLNKAVEDILPSKEELRKLLLSGKRLKIYQGFDPTGPSLHIGHAVSMRKLEDFRKLGHEVYFLIGDFTAMIGDPSDKSSTRQKLSREQVLENLKSYKKEASKIVDIDNKENPVKVVFNYEWLSKLTLEDILELSSLFTVQQMIKRDMFQQRLKENKPIYLSEFLYPLMQGYDSVKLEVDVEVCGNDQMFNALAGRHLSQEILKKNKFVITGKLLTTTGGQKMGKTEGNMIKLSENPRDIYGKVMSFPDEAIVQGFELLTNKDIDEVKEYEKKMNDSSVNPMEVKKELAYQVTKELSSEQEAKDAQKYFEEVFQKKDFNASLEEKAFQENEISLIELLSKTGIAESNGQARRLVDQHAVSIDGQKITDKNFIVKLNQPKILKVGKKVIKIIKG
jgi:tyrosyl-tRNA synthetase